jgi:hypothetical protein
VILYQAVMAGLERIKRRYPDLQVSETDYGCTVSVKRPGSKMAYYLVRTYRAERDGYSGQVFASAKTISAIIRKLK